MYPASVCVDVCVCVCVCMCVCVQGARSVHKVPLRALWCLCYSGQTKVWNHEGL